MYGCRPRPSNRSRIEWEMGRTADRPGRAQSRLTLAARKDRRVCRLLAGPSVSFSTGSNISRPTFSQLAKPHPEDLMNLTLLQNEVRAFPRWGDVFAQVYAVDVSPDPGCHLFGFFRGEVGVAVEVGGLVLEHGVPQREEPLRE